MDLFTPKLNRLLENWLEEDIGRGDLTSLAIKDSIVAAYWVAKENGIFCGGKLVKKLFQKLDPSIEINLLVKDGETFQMGEKILELSGPSSILLSAERTSLNIAMHLSGIATATAFLVEEIKGTGVRLVDTRKTTPGLRLLEKYAVRCGGGLNHRMGLDDAAMLKENHIAWSGGIKESIKILKNSIPWTSKIIVEAETAQQAKEAVAAGANGILLDEMSCDKIRELVPQLRKLAAMKTDYSNSGEIVIEASGINPKEIKNYSTTGVDLISSSAPITQSKWIDLSMRFNEEVHQQ